jgi:hypothetical protein
MKADVQLIKQRLFDGARERIARDFGFNVPATADELSQQVLRSLDQPSCENPLTQQFDNDAVFRAAVRAIGSNSRKWATYLGNERQLKQLLSDFRVTEVGSNPPDCAALAKLLPGITATADARAILNWARLLGEKRDYYATVIVAGANSIPLPPQLLFLGVVARFTDRAYPHKWPGMGFALGSEFLRNLRWNGFKPDRHIKRLLARWTNGEINVQPALNQLLGVIGRKDRDNLQWSLTGMEISPDDHFSRLDNLIWLLGAYVERKGRESNFNYVFKITGRTNTVCR